MLEDSFLSHYDFPFTLREYQMDFYGISIFSETVAFLSGYTKHNVWEARLFIDNPNKSDNIDI
jgi:hypothetical protein